MVKRGSKYLRFALMTAARMVCLNDATFCAFKDRKMAEGKHYMVTMGHVAKKLVRVIYYLLKQIMYIKLAKWLNINNRISF